VTATWPTGWATGDVCLASEFKKGIGAIFDSTLGGSAANVDVTSITGTYAHLLVAVYARGDTAATSSVYNMQFNGDTAANYDSQRVLGTAATAQAIEAFAGTSAIAGVMPANTAGANLFNAGLMFIPHYAGSANNKLALSVSSVKLAATTGNLATYLIGGFWRSSAAITRVTLIPAAGNFVAGTRVTVYGMGA
jgi:hypothetical protein